MTFKAKLLCLFVATTSIVYAQYSEKIIQPKYLFKFFTLGKVYLKSSQIVTASLNYNTLTEEMLFMNDSVILKLDMPGQIDSVVINDRVFITIEKRYYEVLAGSALRLMIQNKSSWDRAGMEVGYGKSKLAKATSTTKNWQSGTMYFDKKEIEVEVFDDSNLWIAYNNRILPATSIKNYIQLFPEFEKSIKVFISKNRIKLNRKMDQISLVDYINKLLQNNKFQNE